MITQRMERLLSSFIVSSLTAELSRAFIVPCECGLSLTVPARRGRCDKGLEDDQRRDKVQTGVIH